MRPRPVIDHRTLLIAAQDLGYKLDSDGLCHGLAYVAMQAMLLGELAEFDERLFRITQALRSPDFQTQLTPEQILSIRAFFDSIILYHRPEMYKELFDQDVKQQESGVAFSLLTPERLQKKGGVQAFAPLCNAYTANELKNLFSDMQTLAQPLVFIISGAHHSGEGAHAIAVGYDPSTQRFSFVDANNLPSISTKKPEDIIQLISDVYKPANNANMLLVIKPIGIKNQQLENQLANYQKNQIDRFDKNKLKVKDAMRHGLLRIARVHHLEEWVTKFRESIEVMIGQSDKDILSVLPDAVLNVDKELMAELLDQGADPNYQSKTSILIDAIALNSSEVVEKLLVSGADPNHKVGNLTPLMAAISQDNILLVHLLLKHGADPNQAINNLTPLKSVIQKNISLMLLLLEYGANPNQVDSKGHAALDLAVAIDAEEKMNLLVEYGADIESKNKIGSSPLQRKNGQYKDFLIDAAETHASVFMKEIKNYIAESTWSVKVGSGKKITLDDGRHVTVPDNVKKQWDQIKLAETGKQTWRETSKNVISIAKMQVNTAKKGRKEGTKKYYGFFESGNVAAIREKIKEPEKKKLK